MPFNSKLLPNKTRFNWRMVRRHKHAVSLCTRIMFFSTAALAYSGIAVAEPTGGVVTGGQGTIAQTGSVTDINQASQQLNIDWQTFSIGTSETVNFYQPGASAIAINRVLHGPSDIRGALNANGRLVFLNQSGITFFEGARVNVGSLMASTAASMTMDNGVMNFSGGGYAQIINRGDITVSDGGFAILAAPHVENSGVITANLGQVHLASATSYTLDLRGDGLITFAVDANAMSNIAVDGEKLGVDNSGTLRAQSGQVMVTVATISRVVNSVVNLGGVVDADAFTADADGGSVLVASSGDLNLTGGIRADGGATGDGGSVVTWADGTNYFNADATISARGGAVSGDGGFVEISGHDVRYRGTVDASATNGAAGTLLLDPANITITDGGAPLGAPVYVDNVPVNPGTVDDVLANGTVLGNQTISEVAIESLSLAGTNVRLVADDTITIEPLLTDGVIQGGSGNIELITTGIVYEFDDETVSSFGTGNITMRAGDTIATTSGDVKISAKGWQANVILGNVTTTQGGDIMVVATDTGPFVPVGEMGAMGDIPGSNISAVSLTTNNTGNTSQSAGSIDLDSNQGSVTLTGATTITSNVDTTFGPESIVRLDIEADDDVTITGDTVITATATDSDSHVVASAIADIEAGTDGSGSVFVGAVGTPVEFNVEAMALSTPGSEAGDSATATASTTMVAANDVTIITPASTLSVTATATNIGTDKGDATADADLNLTANSGNITISGATKAVATALIEPGTENNDLIVTGFADNFDNRVLGHATATADVELRAIGNEDAGNVTADAITVDSDANINVGAVMVSGLNLQNTSFQAFGGGITGQALASAGLNINAGDAINVAGSVSVTGDAHINMGNISMTDIMMDADSGVASFTGVNGNVVGGASADAHAGFFAEGSVTLGTPGDADTIVVAADADVTIGDIEIDQITVHSRYTESIGLVRAGFTGFSEEIIGSTEAHAAMEVETNGAVDLNGPTSVTSDADAVVGDISMTNIAIETNGTAGYGRFASASAGALDGDGIDGDDGLGGDGEDGQNGEGADGQSSTAGTGANGGSVVGMDGDDAPVDTSVNVGSDGGDVTGGDTTVDRSGRDGGSASSGFTGFAQEIIGYDTGATASLDVTSGGPAIFNGAVAVTAHAEGRVGNIAMTNIDVITAGDAGVGGDANAIAAGGDGSGGDGGEGRGGVGGDGGDGTGGDGGDGGGVPNTSFGTGGKGGDGTGGGGGDATSGTGGNGGDGRGGNASATAVGGDGGDLRSEFTGFGNGVVASVTADTTMNVSAGDAVTYNGALTVTSDAGAHVGNINLANIVISTFTTGGIGAAGGTGSASATGGDGVGGLGGFGARGPGGSGGDGTGGDGGASLDFGINGRSGFGGNGGNGTGGNGGDGGNGTGGDGGDGFGGDATASATGGDGGDVSADFVGFGGKLINDVAANTNANIETVGAATFDGAVTVTSDAVATIGAGGADSGIEIQNIVVAPGGDITGNDDGEYGVVIVGGGPGDFDILQPSGSFGAGIPGANGPGQNGGSGGTGTGGSPGADGLGVDGLNGTGTNGDGTQSTQDGSVGAVTADFAAFNDELMGYGVQSSATLQVNAKSGEDDRGDITIIGGVKVAGTATAQIGGLTQSGDGNAHLASGIFSEGYLELNAGQNKEGVGDIHITGDATVDATSNLNIGDGVNNSGGALAFAFGEIDAANHVTIDGTEIGVAATSTTNGEFAAALSLLVVQAGERVLVGGEQASFDEQDGLHEIPISEGDVRIRGDVYSRATATATGDGSVEEPNEIAFAGLELTAHGESSEGGSVINEYLTIGQQPQAVATSGSGGIAFTNATQTDVDAARLNDQDGSPTTFIELSPGGDNSLISGETILPSDGSTVFNFLIKFVESDAATIVHFHETALIFGPQTPPVVGGIDPYILIHSGPVNDTAPLRYREVTQAGLGDTTAPGDRTTSLGLTPGSMVCALGEDGIAVKSDGQLLFAEFMFQETGLEFGDQGCDEVVSFPQVDVQ